MASLGAEALECGWPQSSGRYKRPMIGDEHPIPRLIPEPMHRARSLHSCPEVYRHTRQALQEFPRTSTANLPPDREVARGGLKCSEPDVLAKMGAQRPPVRNERRGLGRGMVQVVKQRTTKGGTFIPHGWPQMASWVAVNASHRKQYGSRSSVDTLHSPREPNGFCTLIALCLL